MNKTLKKLRYKVTQALIGVLLRLWFGPKTYNRIMKRGK